MNILKRTLKITIMDAEMTLEKEGKIDHLNGLGLEKTNSVLLSTKTLVQHITSETLFHEIMHVFGLKHCNENSCLMNKEVKNDSFLCGKCEKELEKGIVKEMKNRLQSSV